MKKATSNRTRRIAKKYFPKQGHGTRPFTAKDYEALPSIPDRKPLIVLPQRNETF